MWNAFQKMLGTGVVIDGCHVGQLMNIEYEQSFDSYPHLTLNVVVTPETREKMREYDYIQSVMGGESIIEKEKPNKRRKSR